MVVAKEEDLLAVGRHIPYMLGFTESTLGCQLIANLLGVGRRRIYVSPIANLLAVGSEV